jgi:hypothetical protein
MELPKAPFYRRWSVLLAGIIGLAAIAALLGWRGLQQVATPATTTTTPSTSAVVPTTTAPPPESSFGPTSKPDEVLWFYEGSDVKRSPGFRTTGAWRIEWEFDCSNFRDLGGGNFKITGGSAFERVDIQADDLKGKGSGRQSFTQRGYGHLLVESVCKRWKVTVLAG